MAISLAVFFFFALGLIIGSFLNVVVIRSAAGESLGGRSSCRSCRVQLKARELIPLLSFCLQKGRCRQCGAVLSKQYFWVELVCGLIFAGVFYVLIIFYGYWTAGFFSQLLFWLALSSSALTVFVTDLRFKIIPHGPVLVILILGIAASLSRHGFSYDMALDLSAALIISLFFALLWLYSKGRWLGLGDTKLIFTTSLLVGYPLSLSAFLFSFWAGGIIGIGLVLLNGRQKIKELIPFGPFILLGALLAYFFGDGFLTWSGLIYLL